MLCPVLWTLRESQIWPIGPVFAFTSSMKPTTRPHKCYFCSCVPVETRSVFAFRNI